MVAQESERRLLRAVATTSANRSLKLRYREADDGTSLQVSACHEATCQLAAAARPISFGGLLGTLRAPTGIDID